MAQTVKLDFPDRDLFILADGDWRGFRSNACAKEPETVEWIRSFAEGSVLWDVGASVGPYTLIAAALGHSVVAFEPVLPSAGHLAYNVAKNRLTDVLVIPVGLNELSGWSPFYSYAEIPGAGSHEGFRHSGNPMSRVNPTQFMTADDAADLFWPANHVKIDVDGAELGVIEGGRVLWKQVDSIMVESEPPTIDDITVILQAAGLEMVNSWKRLGDTKQRNYLYARTND